MQTTTQRIHYLPFTLLKQYWCWHCVQFEPCVPTYKFEMSQKFKSKYFYWNRLIIIYRLTQRLRTFEFICLIKFGFDNIAMASLRQRCWGGSNHWHDDVIKWKHFPHYWTFEREIQWSPLNSSYKDQWRRALMFCLICTRIYGWGNNGGADDSRRHWIHYAVIVMETITATTPKSSQTAMKLSCWTSQCSQHFHQCGL